MRSKKEVRSYLKKKEYSNEAINEAIAKLESQGYLNDKTYIFHINNSVAYNNIVGSSNQYFYLSIIKPKILNANCSLPSIINKGRDNPSFI